MDLLQRIAGRTQLLDGGMGTELMRHGFSSGGCPEEWNVTHPDVVASIHRAYFAAGSDIVNTNTFGGSRLKLDAYGLGERAVEFNTAAALLALDVRDREFPGRLVAGDMGPCGHLLPPMGAAVPAEVAAAFREQAQALITAGVDLINIETMFDLSEAQLAVEAAVSVADGRPVLVSMAFRPAAKGFRTMMGVDPASAVHSLRGAGAALVGCNCEITAEVMAPLVPQLAELNGGLTCAQPNAGQPYLEQGVTVYRETPGHFAALVAGFAREGAGIVGGCCGTTPAFIAALAAALGR
jgi:5-methyltetrahydrofolate--homocysteine methyltransferase